MIAPMKNEKVKVYRWSDRQNIPLIRPYEPANENAKKFSEFSLVRGTEGATVNPEAIRENPTVKAGEHPIAANEPMKLAESISDDATAETNEAPTETDWNRLYPVESLIQNKKGEFVTWKNPPKIRFSPPTD
jgi:hypothetical protein